MTTDIETGFLKDALKRAEESDLDDFLVDIIPGFALTLQETGFVETSDDKKMWPRLMGVSPEDCVELCADDPGCESFSYCIKTENICAMSGYDVDEVSDAKVTKPDPKCSILTKQYLTDYEPSPSSGLETVEKKKLSGISPEKCAKLCTTEKSFNCLSIDFCNFEPKDNTGDCLMHSVHVSTNGHTVEGEEPVIWSSNKTMCTHFSSNLLKEWTTLKGKMLSKGSTASFSDINAEICSEECSEDGSSECTGFEFCEFFADGKVTRTCRLTAVELTNEQTKTKMGCTIYGKPKNLMISKPKPGKRYSSGLTGFLAVFLLVVGLLLGAGAIHCFRMKSSTYA
jgi:hypothetical protein